MKATVTETLTEVVFLRMSMSAQKPEETRPHFGSIMQR